jgi:hypothetical protein
MDSRQCNGELVLPAYVVEKLVWKKPVLGGFD